MRAGGLRGAAAESGVPLVQVGDPVRQLGQGARPPSADDVPRLVDDLIGAWFDQVATAAGGCDALVASGLTPAAAGARSVAERLGIGAAQDRAAATTESPSDALAAALAPRTRARATTVAGMIRTDGATVAARLLLDAVSRERPPVSA